MSTQLTVPSAADFVKHFGVPLPSFYFADPVFKR